MSIAVEQHRVRLTATIGYSYIVTTIVVAGKLQAIVIPLGGNS